MTETQSTGAWAIGLGTFAGERMLDAWFPEPHLSLEGAPSHPGTREVQDGLRRGGPLLVGGLRIGMSRRGDQHRRREHRDGPDHSATLNRTMFASSNRRTDDHALAPCATVRLCPLADMQHSGR